ncbi:MAG: M48 family metallopeptidase [Polyangiaceae bacterium]|nr:M48 family metallopeptidase [Polyangiaceae bacterium]
MRDTTTSASSELSSQGFQRFIQGRWAAAESGPDYAYASDRITRLAFDKLPPMQLMVEAAVRSFWHLQVGQLLGHAVKVGQRQFPRVFQVAGRCAETLGIAPPDLYVVNSPYLNAATYGTRDHSFIVVHSALVDHLSEAELTSVIGHECGHIHNQHVTYLTTLKVLEGLGGHFSALLSLGLSLSLKAWSRRAEITCDRAALLCTKDLDVATRALTKLALGSQRLYDELDVDVFLEQHAELQTNAGRYGELFSSHPWLPKRVLALRLFAESDVYQRRAGLDGAGAPDRSGSSVSKTLAAVDAEVERLVKVVG